MPHLLDPDLWIALLTLSAMEIVLGIDNIVFISILVGRVAPDRRDRIRKLGIAAALVTRLGLLFTLSWIMKLTAPLFEVVGHAISGKDLIMIGGGLFLLAKATLEIHHKLEGEEGEGGVKGKGGSSLGNAILQITVINIVFSFDSILTAVGMTNGVHGALAIMIFAVVLSVLIMMLFATPVARFVNRHPTIQMLGLSFLLLIGFMLIAEGAHLAHVELAGASIGAVPKGYLYFAIAFSLFVEFLNLRLRRRQKPIQLHGVKEEAVKEGIIEELEN